MSDRRIIPQFELGPRIGGVKELATRVTFYNGIANTLMVAGVYYSSNPHVPGVGKLQSIIPTITAFYLALIAAGGAAMVFEHVVMIRAQAEYNQHQQFNEDVSPIRRDVMELDEDLDRLEEKIDELRKK